MHYTLYRLLDCACEWRKKKHKGGEQRHHLPPLELDLTRSTTLAYDIPSALHHCTTFLLLLLSLLDHPTTTCDSPPRPRTAYRLLPADIRWPASCSSPTKVPLVCVCVHIEPPNASDHQFPLPNVSNRTGPWVFSSCVAASTSSKNAECTASSAARIIAAHLHQKKN